MPTPPGRAEHEQRVAFLDMAAVDQRVDARAIGHQQGGTFGEVMGFGQMIDIVHRNRDRLGHSAVAAARDHPVADLELRDTFANFGDQPRDFAAGGKGALGAELILVLDDQHVGGS